MDFFYNAADHMVDEVIDGLARIAPLTRAAPESGVRIVVDAHWTPDRVAVLAGGGAGHEPSHAGFVGRGMLAAGAGRSVQVRADSLAGVIDPGAQAIAHLFEALARG